MSTTPIAEQLQAAIIVRMGIPGGQTIGSFIEALRTFGEDTLLASIEYGIAQDGNGRIVAELTEQGLEIREGRAHGRR